MSGEKCYVCSKMMGEEEDEYLNNPVNAWTNLEEGDNSGFICKECMVKIRSYWTEDRQRYKTAEEVTEYVLHLKEYNGTP